jgi:hypothetical protein
MVPSIAKRYAASDAGLLDTEEQSEAFKARWQPADKVSDLAYAIQGMFGPASGDPSGGPEPDWYDQEQDPEWKRDLTRAEPARITPEGIEELKAALAPPQGGYTAPAIDVTVTLGEEGENLRSEFGAVTARLNELLPELGRLNADYQRLATLGDRMTNAAFDLMMKEGPEDDQVRHDATDGSLAWLRGIIGYTQCAHAIYPARDAIAENT